MPKKILTKRKEMNKIAILMNDCFINTTKNSDLKHSTVSNITDIDKITKRYDDHISVCKINEAYSELLREDNFSFDMASMDEVKIPYFPTN